VDIVQTLHCVAQRSAATSGHCGSYLAVQQGADITHFNLACTCAVRKTAGPPSGITDDPAGAKHSRQTLTHYQFDCCRTAAPARACDFTPYFCSALPDRLTPAASEVRQAA